MNRFKLIVPELELDRQSVVLGLWLVKRGARTTAGEPVVELTAGETVIDLPAPADGVLVKRLAGEDEPVKTGQCLGLIEADE